MRIGLFTDTYPPYINGVSTSVLMLRDALEKLGHTVYVVTVNDDALHYNDSDDRVLRIPGIPIGIYDYRLTGIYPLKAVQVIKDWHLDVIHTHTEFGVGTFARIIAKQFNIPLVHTYHTMYEDYTHYITHGHFDKSAKKIVEQLTLFYCDKTTTELIVPTKKAYDLFKQKYQVERSVHIVPTGLEVERFYLENADTKKVAALRRQYHIDKKDFVLVFVGRLAAEKNIEFLIRVAKKMYDHHKNFRFLIVGGGPDEQEYKDLANELGISDAVIFTGKVAYSDIPTYYHMATLFATASQSETQGLTVIEAMASSLPALCIEDESFKNVVDDGLDGIIFHTEEECYQGLEKLYQDETELKRMSKQARIKADSFSSKHYAESVLDVYRYAIHEKNKNKKKGFFRRIIDRIKGES